ncbi:MAG TPA: methyltransferase [Polyangiaceae bacterium]|nr:methyltransferase [Polyangiaceae bacterium]
MSEAPLARSAETEAARALATALRILLPVLDIVALPPAEAEPPEWCRRRGWDEFLLALDESELAACEAHGLWQGVLRENSAAPASLRELAEEVELATRPPRVAVEAMPLPSGSLRGVSARKREQLGALLAASSSLAAHATRIVDVGAGSGHLSRLAAELFERETLGVDRDAERSAAAREWGQARARDVGTLPLRYVVADACAEPTPLSESDLLFGLHACGELGDRLVLDAGHSGADLALVSCCLQKIAGPRRQGLSRMAAALSLPRPALGLANLSVGPEGVETSLIEALRARGVRFALRLLLQSRGVTLEPGEEMRGINRRRARGGLFELAQRALLARSLPAASSEEITEFERAATKVYARVRRLSLPRNLLARLLEQAIVLDRAVALEECGHAVRVATFCERAVTPRNLALFASRDEARLPALRAVRVRD